jgi:ATP-binding cassette subfamily C protein
MTDAFAILRDAYRHAGSRLLLMLLLMLLVGLTDGLSMALLYPLLAAAGIGGSVGGAGSTGILDATYKWLFGAIGVAPTLGPVAALLVGSFFVQALLFTAQNWLLTDIQKKYIAAWQRELFSALMRSEWSYFSSKKVGELVNVILVETIRLGAALFAILQLIVAGLVLCIYLAISLFISWKITLYLTIGGLILIALVRPIRLATRRYGAEAGEINAALATALNEMFAGAKVIKATATEARADALMYEQTERLRENLTWGAFLPTTIRGAFEFAAILLVLGMLVWGVQVEQISAAQVLVVIALMARLFPRLINIQVFHNALNLSAPAFALLRRLQAETARCAESRRVGQASTDPGRILPADITAENLVVCHDETPVLNGVSFSIPAGQVIGFVGPSGAGKSTLVDSLLGLIVPSEGKIAVGDVSLGDVDLHGWRRRIGYVSQDTFLFHDTIANNIRWSVPDAPMQAVVAAARAAGLEGFVASLDLGFDTIVGDRGVKLSGGQRQRISLARALMRDPNLLILDEATSALDSLSEQEVMGVINALRGKCTVVIVAHRLAAVRDADLIYVLDGGVIIEHGTWRSLTQRKALFHRLLQAQAVGDR